jgi:hypothetical protein
MKTKKLIEELMKIDPAGECEVYSIGDIEFLQRLPWYYDGRPGVLIRDLDNTFEMDGNVVGIRQHTEEDGDKIYLHCKCLDDFAWDVVVDKADPVIIGDEHFIEKWKRYKEEVATTMAGIKGSCGG